MSMMIFNEESKIELKQIVENMVLESNALISDLNCEIIDVYERTKYERLGLFANNFFKTYNEEFLGEIIPNLTNAWVESSASLISYAQSMSVGESAEEFVSSIESAIQDSLSDFRQLDELEIASDGQINISVKDFLAISNAVKKAKDNSSKIYGQTISRINRYVEDNTVAISLKPVLQVIPKVFFTFSEKLDLAFEKFAENFEARLNSQEGTVYDLKNNTPRDAEEINRNNNINSSVSNGPVEPYPAPGGEGNTFNTRKRVPKCFKELKRIADLHYYNVSPNNTKKLCEYIYDKTIKEISYKTKTVPYEIIKALMPIFEDYYQSFGAKLVWKDNPNTTQAAHARAEYVFVTNERKNVEFFNDGEAEEFFNRCGHDYSVFDTVARMISNICDEFISTKKITMDTNLTYALYLFSDVFIKTDSKMLMNDQDYKNFSVRTALKIYEIIGENITKQNHNTVNDDQNNFTGNGDQNNSTGNGYKNNSTGNGYKNNSTGNGDKNNFTGNGDKNNFTGNGDKNNFTGNDDDKLKKFTDEMAKYYKKHSEEIRLCQENIAEISDFIKCMSAGLVSNSNYDTKQPDLADGTAKLNSQEQSLFHASDDIYSQVRKHNKRVGALYKSFTEFLNVRKEKAEKLKKTGKILYSFLKPAMTIANSLHLLSGVPVLEVAECLPNVVDIASVAKRSWDQQRWEAPRWVKKYFQQEVVKRELGEKLIEEFQKMYIFSIIDRLYIKNIVYFCLHLENGFKRKDKPSNAYHIVYYKPEKIQKIYQSYTNAAITTDEEIRDDVFKSTLIAEYFYSLLRSRFKEITKPVASSFAYGIEYVALNIYISDVNCNRNYIEECTKYVYMNFRNSPETDYKIDVKKYFELIKNEDLKYLSQNSEMA